MRRFTRVRDQSISGSVTGPSDANWQRALEPALDHPAHTCLDSVPTGGRCPWVSTPHSNGNSATVGMSY